MHVYTPWWLDNKKLDFPRGYHIEYSGGMDQPAYGFGRGIEGINGQYAVNGKKKEAGGYGKSLKEDYRFFYRADVSMAGRGEAIAQRRAIADQSRQSVHSRGGRGVEADVR